MEELDGLDGLDSFTGDQAPAAAVAVEPPYTADQAQTEILYIYGELDELYKIVLELRDSMDSLEKRIESFNVSSPHKLKD